MSETIQIKKYGNRRLYDIARKTYITQDELVALIEQGHEVRISDAKTGEDITQSVLIQIILENQKKSPNALFSTKMLHQLIQYQDQSIYEFFHEYLPSLFNSYLHWHQQAHNQFMRWANLGWSQHQYTPDFFMPGFNLWEGKSASSSREPQETQSTSNGEVSEINLLKEKIVALEKRLNKSGKRD